MRALLQRVSSAAVTIEGRMHGSIERGLVVLLGVEESDTTEDIDWLAPKIAGLRLFPGDDAPWDRSVLETGGGILLMPPAGILHPRGALAFALTYIYHYGNYLTRNTPPASIRQKTHHRAPKAMECARFSAALVAAAV